MDIVTYAILKKQIAATASGISSIALNSEGTGLIFTTTGGQTLTVTIPQVTANGIKNLSINSSGHLIATLDDDNTVDCGEVPSGKSAYDIAVDNGFTGTEEQWLESLKGSISLSTLIVSELPTSNISTTTIYLVASTNADGNDCYNEYIYTNGAWERLGTRDASTESTAENSDIDTIF